MSEAQSTLSILKDIRTMVARLSRLHLIDEEFASLRQAVLQATQEIHDLKEAYIQLPRWYPLGEIAKDKGITRQALRGKLLSGAYEPDVDFKYEGSRIFIARAAVSRISRKRQ